MKRSGPIPRKTRLAAKRPIKRKPAKDRPRTHGPKDFSAWLRQQPCAACGVLGYSEPAHLLGNGGMGRKKGWETIGPLCGPHSSWGGSVLEGCHHIYDNRRSQFISRFPQFRPALVADATHAAYLHWRRHNP